MSVTSSVLSGGIGLIELKGTLIGEDETMAFRNAVNEFVGRHWRRLIIDMTGTTYMNSAAIGVFVAAHASFSKRDWQIKICGVSKNINVIFAITKLTQIFSIHDTREQAIQSFT